MIELLPIVGVCLVFGFFGGTVFGLWLFDIAQMDHQYQSRLLGNDQPTLSLEELIDIYMTPNSILDDLEHVWVDEPGAKE